MAFLKAGDSLNGLADTQKFRFIEIFLKEAKRLLNGNLILSDNVSFPAVEVKFQPNVETAVQHNLGRIPRGYLVISKNAAADFYSASRAADSTNSYLISTAAVTANIVFL